MQPTPIAAETTAVYRLAIVILAPAVALAGHAYHPWIGSPGDAAFLAGLGAAVAADPIRWAVAHLLIAVGSGLVALAFLALRSYLREAGDDRWSAVGIPFAVMGSVLYALLPAMEFAPVAAAASGADPAAVQGAMLVWFEPVLLAAAAVFAVGAVAFAVALVRMRSQILSPVLAWIAAIALVVLALTRFLPVGAAQLYIGPAAAVVAFWSVAWVMWKRPIARAPRP